MTFYMLSCAWSLWGELISTRSVVLSISKISTITSNAAVHFT